MEYTRNNYTIQGKIISSLILELINKVNCLERTTKINKINNDSEIASICELYKDLLEIVFLTFYEDLTENENKECLIVESTISEKITFKKILLKILVYIRDIRSGLGKYDLYYRLIGVYCKTLDKVKHTDNKNKKTSLHDNMMSYLKLIIRSGVILNNNNNNNLPYGSWKDMKYLLNHLRDIYGEKELLNKEIFKYIIEIICFQLKKDVTCKEEFSLLSKWIPREKSKKFGWQNKYIAISFATDCYDLTEYINKNIHNKSEMAIYCSNLRRTIACINKIIQTPQINQCKNSWCLIDFNNVSKITLKKQNNAFKYENKYGLIKGTSKDRLNCRINHMKYENDNYMKYNKNICDTIHDNDKLPGNVFTPSFIDEQKYTLETLELKWKNLISILFNERYKNIDLFII